MTFISCLVSGLKSGIAAVASKRRQAGERAYMAACHAADKAGIPVESPRYPNTFDFYSSEDDKSWWPDRGWFSRAAGILRNTRV